jgi:hypothetical protein
MRSVAVAFAVLALIALGCGGAADGGGTTPRSRSSAKRADEQPKADYDDENSVGMSGKRVTRWRWKGSRKDCFYVVGNKCFESEKAACKAAGCKRDCRTDDSAPVQVSCPKR